MGEVEPSRPRADRDRRLLLLAALGGLVLLSAMGPAIAETSGTITDACQCWLPASSGPSLVFSMTLHNNSMGSDWESSVAWANLTFTSVTGFNASVDLATLTGTTASGVAFYNESGGSAGFQPAQDVLVGAPTPATWFESPAGTYRVNFTFSGALKLPSFTANSNVYVVIRTSGGVTDGDTWKAGLGANDLNATWGNFPGSAFQTANIVADTNAPTSSVDAISPYWKNAAATITATASDGGSGVQAVSLFYRYSTDNATWGGWTFSAVDTSSPYSWSFPFSNGTGYYEFYTQATDVAGNVEAAPGSADAIAAFDNVAPTSSVNAIDPYWRNTAPAAITATASDPLSGVATVDLYYRFSPDNATWGGWVFDSTDGTSPYSYSFGFSNGTGYYEFYSQAFDVAGNTEAAPGSADALAGFDNVAPVSAADTISPYWRNTSPVTVTAAASDTTSGVLEVGLYWRFSTDNSSWGAWTFEALDTTSPYSWTFAFTGEGYYEFYTQANDTAGNSEAVPAAADSGAGYDTTAPTSSVDLINPYWRNANPSAIAATASDALSGVVAVDLSYRYSGDNISFGAWTFFATDMSSPFSFAFTWPDGEGYYEFYTTANDTATNSESAPGGADAIAAFDSTRPTSTVDALSPYWGTTTPRLVTATASDALSGVDRVELWYQFSVDNVSFGAGILFASDPSSPYMWNFTFPSGQGFYRFYSIAVDVAANSELAPGTEDAIAGYDATPPATSVDTVSPYWSNAAPRTLTVTATDAVSGVTEVGLWYRFAPDNASFGAWNFFGVDATSPYTFSFPFSDGEGYYEFYSIGNDTAGNSETPPVSRDALAGYDTTTPSSSVTAITPYWLNTSPTTIAATASDALSGVARVSLWYRVSPDNISFGAWTFFAFDSTSPYTFDFTFPGGQGYYEFYSVANDTATNSEASPGSGDALAGYDTSAPSSSVTALSPYWGTSSPRLMSATAADALSGVARVSLWYRFSANNASFGAWTFSSFDATAPYSFSFAFPGGQGYYEFYTIANDTATNSEAAPGARDALAGYDTTPPVTSVDTVSPYWRNAAPLTLTATAGDALSGVDRVSLWYRFSLDNASFGAWTFFGSDASAPYTFSFPFSDGQGYYEFYSIGNDTAGNTESAPAGRDALAGYDTTTPTSSVNAISPYWIIASPKAIDATASDALSGVARVSLWYRFSPDNISFGAWTFSAFDATAPYTFSFTFPSGQGYYEFYTIANDTATNTESAPAARDALAAFDTTAPSSAVSTPSTYWGNTSPRTLDATASDALSGVARVSLWYRSSPDNISFGAWTFFGFDATAPYSFVFTFPAGQGYYEFYSIGNDTATNSEAAPAARDALVGYDTAPPTTSVDASSPYWRNAGPVTLTVTASDALSGVSDVGLWFRFAPDNATFGVWTFFATDSSAPFTFSFTFPSGQGYYEFYSIGNDRAGNSESAPASRDAVLGLDTTAPTSSANAISPYWLNTSPKAITATASDALSGVAQVGLWYRFAGDNATWGAWSFFAVDATAPYSFSFTFPAGQGYYEFYSIANDTAGNGEAPPGARDALAGFDTSAPTSSVTVISPYWGASSPRTFSATAADALSGVARVSLWYRFSPDNATFGAWTFFGFDSTSPYTFGFTFPGGQGYYEFYSIANDTATNSEAAPGARDALAGHDTTPPTTSVNAIAPYWGNASPLLITATASDSLSGVAQVGLWYRFSGDNVTFGAWTAFGNDATAPYTFSFTFPGGQGYYEFYSIGSDTAGNTEAAPAGRDALAGYDTTAPTSSVNAISPYWKNTSPAILTATAADALSGVARVSLWYRFSPDNISFGAWTFSSFDATAPYTFSFAFPGGQGYYEFYTIANDTATNSEAAPGARDTLGAFDSTAPSSSVNAVSPYWRNTNPITVTATASDALSGVASVSLFYRHAPDNATFSSWTLFATDSAAPFSWAFTWPSGEGYYEFYSTAKDVADNTEAAPAGRDTLAGFDASPPTSSANGLSPYWGNTSPITISATASDGLSGLSGVSLWYRFSAANVSFGAWTLFGTDTTPPYSFSFTFPDGQGYYEFYTTGTDVAGNSEAAPASRDALVGFDTTRPASVVDAISPYWRNTSPVTITATAGDALSGVASVTLWVRFSADNATFGAFSSFGTDTTAPYSFSFTFPSGQGYYEFYTIAVDVATNTELAPGARDAFAGFDTTPPTSSVNTISPYWKTTSPVTITATAADALSLVAEVRLQYRFAPDNVTWTAWAQFAVDTTSPYSFSFTFPSGQGYYEFRTVAMDRATNVEAAPASADDDAGYDATAPSSSVGTLPGYWFTATPITVPWTATDNLALNNVSLQYRYRATNASAFGAWTITAWDPTASGTSDSGTFTFSFPAGQGFYQFRTIANDRAGNVEAAGAADQECGYDVTVPDSSATVTGFWHNSSPLAVDFTATDNVELRTVLLEYRFRPDTTGAFGPWTAFATVTVSGNSASGSFAFTWPDGEGDYRFRTIAGDAAGNLEAAGASDAGAGYDATRPTSNVLLLPSYTTVTVFTVTADALDDLSDVAYVELFYRKDLGTWTLYSVDTAAPWTWSFDTGTTGGDGRYEIFSRATDNANNLENQPFAADTITIVDTTPPTSSLAAVTPYWRTTTPLTALYTANDNLDLDRVTLEYRYRLDNGSAFSAWTVFAVDASPSGTSSSGSFAFTFPNGEGHYELRSLAQDAAGNLEAVGAADVRIGYDGTAPVTSVDALSAYRNTRSFTITVTVTEATSGTVDLTLHYRKDGGTWGPYGTRTSAPWSFTFDTAGTGGDGFYEFHTTSRDLAGNVEDAPLLRDTFTTVDTTAATSRVQPLATYSNSATVTVTATASDGLSGLTSVDLFVRRNGAAWSSYGADTAAPWSWSVATGGLGGDGLYEFYSVAQDVAGNPEPKATVAEASITVDTAAPTSSLFALATTQSTSVFTVTASASDALSGVDQVDLYYRHQGGTWTLYGTVGQSPWTFTVNAAISGGDGLYEFYVVATDVAGNVESKAPASETSTTVDTAAPTSSADALPAFRLGTFVVTATANDGGSGVDSVDLYFNVNGGAWTVLGTDAASPWSFTVDPSALGGDGLYAFYTVARDAAGNAESKAATQEASTRVDTTDPASSLRALAVFTATDPFQVTADASDDGSGLASLALSYRLDGGAWSPAGTDLAAPWAFSFSPSTFGGDGLYEFMVLATDAAGNVESKVLQAEAATTVDTTAPSATAQALPPFTATRLLTVIADVPADLSGVVDVTLYYRLNGGSWSVYAEDTSAPFAWTFDSGLTGGDGVYDFRTSARDAAGNVEPSSVIVETSTRVDTVSPTSSLSPLAVFQTTSTFQVFATPSDVGSGILDLTLYTRHDGGPWSAVSTLPGSPWVWDIDVTATGDGRYDFWVLARDNAGNLEAKSALAEATTSVDTKAPVSLVVNLPALQSTTTFPVTASVTDAVSGAASAELFYRRGGGTWSSYGVDAGAPFQWIFDTSGTGGDGVYEFYAVAVDLAGNAEAKAPASEASTLVDLTAPSSNADPLSAYTRTTVFSVTASAIDVESGLTSVRLFYSKDGGPWTLFAADTASPWSYTFDISVTGGDGTYAFRTVSTDLAGNEELVPVLPDTSTLVDTHAPVSTVAVTGTLGNGGWFVSLATVTLSASDPSPSSGFTSLYRIDGGAWTPYTSAVSVSTDGRHLFEYVSADVAGNAETVRSISVSVDMTPPASAVIPLGAQSLSSLVILGFTASDGGSGIASVEVWVATGTSFLLQGTFTSSPVAFQAVGDGTYRFYTVARDLAGNVEAAPATADATILIDTTPPVTVAQAQPAWTTSPSVTLGLTATDGLSGVDHTEYRIDGLAWTLGATVTVTGDGVHTIGFRSYDTVGNVEAERTTTLGIDTSPPIAVASSVPRTTQRLIDVHFTATDGLSGSAGVELWVSIDGGVWTRIGTGLYTTSPVAYIAPGLGVYTFRATGHDVAGNEEPGDNGETVTEVAAAQVVTPPTGTDTTNLIQAMQSAINLMMILFAVLLAVVATLLAILVLGRGRRREPPGPAAPAEPPEKDDTPAMPLEYYDTVEEVPADELPAPEGGKEG